MTQRPPLLPYRFFSADAPGLPVREPDDPGGPEHVVKATLAGEVDHGVVLSGVTQSDEKVEITVRLVSDGIARIRLHLPGRKPDPRSELPPHCHAVQEPERQQDLPSQQALQENGKTNTRLAIERTPQRIRLVSNDLEAAIDLDPFRIAFLDAGGRTLLAQNFSERDATDLMTVLPFGFSRVDGKIAAFHDSFDAEPDEHFYGFGEKFTDFDKRGQRLVMWHHDAYGVHGERAHKNVPFFVSTRGYGLLVNSYSCVHFDMAKSNNAAFSLIVPDDTLDYCVIAGPGLDSVISRYSDLVGLPTLPPKWAFGLWVSGSFQPDSQEAVIERARRLRAEKIPSDVLHIDCYWQRFGRWSEMLFDRKAFPDPEKMIAELKAMGFKVCLWMNPYLSQESARFTEAKRKGFLLKNRDGKPCVEKLWGDFHPWVGLVDLSFPEAKKWFQGLLKPLLEMGVDVFKTDFGEGVPAGAVSRSGLTGEKLHNLYPLLYNDAVAEATEAATGHAGLVWARSSHSGGQRHAAQWAGDPNCTFRAMASTLRGGLSLAICGHPFWSHDMGGFHGTPSPVLFVRWCQFGFLSPLSRAHGRTSRLPWEFGDEALRIFRNYARLRYRLLPYIYSSAVDCAERGLPLMRPMVLENPEDPALWHLDLQYMLGSDLLVAPIYNAAGRRHVFFPAGSWIDVHTREKIDGPVNLFVEAPLDRLPLFVRGNALIPQMRPKERIEEAPFDLVIVDAYLLDRGTLILRDMDGTTALSAALVGTDLVVQAGGAKRQFGFRLIPLPGIPRIGRVLLNGSQVKRKKEVRIDRAAEPGWTMERNGTLLAMLRVEEGADSPSLRGKKV